jgi:alkylated DNA repair protein (DNA oxidative demethylase)
MPNRVGVQTLEGFRYVPEFLSAGEERQILERLEQLSLASVYMHGVVAKRRVLHFGWQYGYESWKLTAGSPIPEWLLPLRERIGRLADVPPEQLEQVLITQYPPAAGIGWHRDAPMFGPTVVGVALLGFCRFRFQRKEGGVREISEQLLEPRSAYLLGGPARSVWQHSIPPVKTLRYSMTFRTVKRLHPQDYCDEPPDRH